MQPVGTAPHCMFAGALLCACPIVLYIGMIGIICVICIMPCGGAPIIRCPAGAIVVDCWPGMLCIMTPPGGTPIIGCPTDAIAVECWLGALCMPTTGPN